ncbi:hypothetical protein Tco_1353819 [Tanacetum coccineum]
MDEVDIKDLTIEQYLRLTQENQTPKKIEDMTIAEYVEYEKKMNENHISNTKSYLPTYFYMEEEVEYMTNDEVVMREQEESNHGYPQNFQHFEENDDVNKWFNAEITKHMSMQGVENTEDALISIIKSIKKEMKDDIMKKKIEASTANIVRLEKFTWSTLDKGGNLDPLEIGALRMWICFRDHERRTVKGSYMGFADFLHSTDHIVSSSKYSASVEEVATIVCFCIAMRITLPTRNCIASCGFPNPWLEDVKYIVDPFWDLYSVHLQGIIRFAPWNWSNTMLSSGSLKSLERTRQSVSVKRTLFFLS